MCIVRAFAPGANYHSVFAAEIPSSMQRRSIVARFELFLQNVISRAKCGARGISTSLEAPGGRLVNARRLLACCLVFSVLSVYSPAQSSNNSRLDGFSTQASTQEREWEKKFQDGVVADNLRESLRRLSAR